PPVTCHAWCNTRAFLVGGARPLYLSEALRGETVALAPRDDGDWAIRFRGFDLAVLGERAHQLRRSGLARTVRPASGEPGVAAARTCASVVDVAAGLKDAAR